MFLEQAKKSLHELNQLKRKPIQTVSCSGSEIEVLTKKTNLPIPKAYEEFLLWMGNKEGLFLTWTGDYWREVFGKVREAAIESMKLTKTLDTLPKDAIILSYDDGGEFCFIRAFEGDNPPVHMFPDVEVVLSGGSAQICWNYAKNIEELCLQRIKQLTKLELYMQHRMVMNHKKVIESINIKDIEID